MKDKMLAHLEISLLGTSYSSLLTLSVETLENTEKRVRGSVSSKGYASDEDVKTLLVIRCKRYCMEENMDFYRVAIKEFIK